jgi:hypothetical protein
MIGLGDELRAGPRDQLLDQGLQQAQLRELIAGTLKKQHRDRYLRQVARSLIGWPSRGVQGESEER